MTAEGGHRPPGLIARAWSSSAVRYLTAGGIAFLFDAGFLWLLHEVLRVPLVIATPVAFLTSFVVTYSLQRTLAFRSEESVAPSVVRYAALVAINTVVTTAIVAGIAALGAPWLVGKVVAVIVTTISNYFVYRYWVFARPRKPEPDV